MPVRRPCKVRVIRVSTMLPHLAARPPRARTRLQPLLSGLFVVS